jgi:hypothetical protein
MKFLKENFTSLVILGLFFVALGNFSWNVYFSLKDIRKEVHEIYKILDESKKTVLF